MPCRVALLPPHSVLARIPAQVGDRPVLPRPRPGRTRAVDVDDGRRKAASRGSDGR
ncbi:hypothetical protein OsJ_17408 [Oryza sativa Japonica Group]|uniref:Uncharacterized protein n=1 Tax=Oryza sativa subsp. japonica TaxID=39947 RepID=B9FMW2_ORYSJ|nr:hypothetical protein OsJ_17408 [Oryza sativa Japonica Group]